MSLSDPTDKLDTLSNSPWPLDDSTIDMLYGISLHTGETAEDIDRRRAANRVENSISDLELSHFQNTQGNGDQEWQGGQEIMYIRPRVPRIEEGVGWNGRGEPSYPAATHLPGSIALRAEHHPGDRSPGLRAG